MDIPENKNANKRIDACLLSLAVERMAHYDSATVISREELQRRFGITDEDLTSFTEVEFEDYILATRKGPTS